MSPWTRLATFRSKSNPTKKYIVALNDSNDTLGCDCPAWKFKKGNKAPCKHITAFVNDDFDPGEVELTPEGVKWAMRHVALRFGGSR